MVVIDLRQSYKWTACGDFRSPSGTVEARLVGWWMVDIHTLRYIMTLTDSIYWRWKVLKLLNTSQIKWSMICDFSFVGLELKWSMKSNRWDGVWFTISHSCSVQHPASSIQYSVPNLSVNGIKLLLENRRKVLQFFLNNVALKCFGFFGLLLNLW